MHTLHPPDSGAELTPESGCWLQDVEEAFNYFAAGGDSMDLATFSKLARSLGSNRAPVRKFSNLAILGQTPSGEEIATITAGAEAINLEQ